DGRVALYSELTIGLTTLKKKRTKIPHPFGVVIGKGVTIGYDCRIYQGVTIGAKLEDGISYPVIGNNVTIYANSVIVGDIIIGNNVIIGASTLVIIDVPDNSVVVGNPARILSRHPQ
ncbi:serine O-acetyltransferase, partial [Rahnella aceris]|uniref:serine O-acetyltransferase n=2 Tax=Rahnella TaxID=34037 RepID=UPI001C27C2E3